MGWFGRDIIENVQYEYGYYKFKKKPNKRINELLNIIFYGSHNPENENSISYQNKTIVRNFHIDLIDNGERKSPINYLTSFEYRLLSETYNKRISWQA